MPYKVDFVGLVHFSRMGRKEPLLMMPDGRNPGGRIDPHYAGVWVHRDQVADGRGWWPLVAQNSELEANGVVEYRIMEPSRIAISGQDAGVIDATNFTGKFPVLKERAPGIVINPKEARTIAQIDIRQGILTALEVRSAIIADLNVRDHRGPIRITATPFRERAFADGTTEKVLVLNDLPADDMAGGLDRFFIANFSNKPAVINDAGADHFQIYKHLDSGGKVGRLKTPTTGDIQALNADRFFSNHPFGQHLRGGFGEVDGSQCSITGCC